MRPRFGRPRGWWTSIAVTVAVVVALSGGSAAAVLVGARKVQSAVVKPVSSMVNQTVPRPTDVPTATSLPDQPTPTPAPIPTATATPLPTLSGTQRINVLLLGSDTDEKFQGTYNTQIIMVASIDPVRHRVTLFSIPRDFWVPIPGQGVQKIQLAYRYGGVALVRETVEDDFGIPIDRYAWVGLEGFVKVIDTAGGVNVDVTHPVLDNEYPDDVGTTNPFAYRRIYIPPGPQHLDGMEALAYVRSRHGDLIGDFGRSQRQQQVLLKLRQKVEQPGTLLKIPAYVDALNGYVRSDFSVQDLWAYANFARTVPRNQIDQVVLQPPTYADTGWSRDGQAIVIPKWPEVRGKVREVFRSPTAPAAANPPQAAEALNILVENGSGSPGLASQAVTYLQGLGYTVLPARDASRQALARTTITVRSQDLVPEVEPLAMLFHADTLVGPQTASGLADVVITLGQSHGSFTGIA